jgi:uncharacterized membrane protein
MAAASAPVASGTVPRVLDCRSMPRTPFARSERRRRYGRDTLEFSRVVNLSDGVFAIAMTLLVLTLDVPDPRSSDLAAALVDRVPQFVAFVLSFLLVANIWWAHHKFFSLLERVEPGIMVLTLASLGAVALVPFPTSLIGNIPGDRAAVIPFIALFTLLIVLQLGLVMRARAVRAYRWHLPPTIYPWVVATWAAAALINVLALSIAFFHPVAGLVIAAASGTVVGVGTGLLAPKGYDEWV